MKIGFFIYHLRSGGAERVITTLANNFAEQQFEVNIYTISEEAPFYKLDEKVNHVKLGIRRKAFIGKFNVLNQFRKLYINVKRDKPDVLISFIDKNNLIAIIVARSLRIPIIISERSNPEKYDYSPIILNGFKMLYNKANAIVLQTSAVANGFRNMHIKLPESFVITNPLDPVFFSASEHKKENIILSVGRLSKEKGHDILLEAIERKRPKNWNIVIVGDGPLLRSYKSFVDANNLTGSVVFEGRKNDVLSYYDKAKIFVLPSRFEGFPNALVEAMARGCVVIAADCDYGPSEIIKPNENGYLFKIEAADELQLYIEKLIDNTELINKMSMQAIQTAKNFSLAKVSNDWLKVINKVIG